MASAEAAGRTVKRDVLFDPSAWSEGITAADAVQYGVEWSAFRDNGHWSDGYTVSDGLRRRPGSQDRPLSEKINPKYPLDKCWADMGAELDIEVIRRKDRSRFGGPVGAWSTGPTPRRDGWIPVDEWLASLPDDGRAWRNGISIDPGNNF